MVDYLEVEFEHLVFLCLKQKANVKVKPKTPASVPDMYILIGIGELKCIIEVDRHVKTY